MISIKQILTRQFIVLTIFLLFVAGSLYGWHMKSTVVRLQERSMAEESQLIYEMLSVSSDRQTFRETLDSRRVPNHAYIVYLGDETWLSRYASELKLPTQQWLKEDVNSFEYHDEASNKYFLVNIKSYPATNMLPMVQVAVVKEITGIRGMLIASYTKIGLIMLVFLAVMAYLQRLLMSLSFAHFDVIRREILALQRGYATKLSEPTFDETAPLIDAINELAEGVNNRTQRTRNAIGNLSHAMKTPMAVLSQVAASREASISQATREIIQQQVDQLDQLVQRELQRAVIAGDHTYSTSFSLDSAVAGIVDTVKMIHRNKSIEIAVTVASGCEFPGEKGDFMELVGNLMDNAAKWCERYIALRVQADQGGLLLCVEDDGDGCDEEQLGSISRRGVRLDESLSGTGLGLGIVKDIVQHYRGEMNFERSKLGGLAVHIEIPLNRQLVDVA